MLSRLRGIHWPLGESLRLLGTGPKKLPAALKLHQRKYGLYIDKTPHLATLFDTDDKRVLFALPRRLGKTTYVDLVEQLCKDKSDFEETELGQTDFFKAWPESVPCVKFDFQFGILRLEKFILSSIIEQAEAAEVPLKLKFMNVGQAFSTLLNGLYAKKKQDVVVLIDEYDAPLNTSNSARKDANVEVLTDFFGAVKAFKHLKLLMVVGTMNRLNLLSSQINDIIDITVNESYAKMFGFTKEEVENKVFPPEDTAFYNRLDFEKNQTITSAAANYQKQQLLARDAAKQQGVTTSTQYAIPPESTEEAGSVKFIVPSTVPKKRELFLQQVKEFYDGYLFSTMKGYEPMYNPFSVLRCKQEAGRIDCYWADTKYLRELNTFITHFPHLMDKDAVITINSKFTDAHINEYVLTAEDEDSLVRLWTTGFLTIHKFENEVYTLIPTNGEVITAYNSQVLRTLKPIVFSPQLADFIKYATVNDFKGLFLTINEVLKSESNRIFAEHDITSTLTWFCSLTNGKVEGIREVTGENRKKMDIMMRAGKYVYVIELKMKKTTEEAINQLEARGYCKHAFKKFNDPENPEKNPEPCVIYAIGLNYAHNEGVSAVVKSTTLLPDGEIKYTPFFTHNLR